jgi:hypothetical protein
MGLFDDKSDDHRPAILAELDSFNDAPAFGMMGILEQQLGDEQAQGKPDEKEEGQKTETKPVDPEQYYAPLNSSIQELGSRVDNRLNDMERSINETKQAATRQSAPAPAIDYDPDEPVSRGSYETRMQQLAQFAYEGQLNTEYTKAQLHLAHFKMANPDFKITPAELEQTWNRGVGQDLQKARNINWNALFEQSYNAQQAPNRDRDAKELAQLRKEKAEWQAAQTKPASRNQRIEQPVSPAVGTRSARSIESVTNHTSDDDIVNLPSFKKGKSFKSYAKEVMRHKGLGLG